MNLFDGRYEKIDLIGRGAFAEVWQATDTQTGVTLALKIFNAGHDMDDEGIKMLTREFALMIDADHRNLLRPLYFGISHDSEPQAYLTLPYCKNGNINKMMGKMTEREAWKLIRDTASALAYLHAMDPPIIHQDIKPANILIGNDGYYKLSDFGVSIRAKSTLSSMAASDMAFSSAGTISYMAPEKFSRDTRPIMANDIWSLGAMVYEMLANDLPFGNDGGLLQKKGADIPELQGDFSVRLKQTLDDCLQSEPWKRPRAAQLEETAIDALSKAPTVKMGEAPIITEAPRPIENVSPVPVTTPSQSPTPSQAPQPAGSSKKHLWLAALVVILIIIGIGSYFLFATPQQEAAVAPQPEILEQMQENPEQVQSPMEQASEPEQQAQKPVEQAPPIETAPVKKTEEKEAQTTQSKVESVSAPEKKITDKSSNTEGKPKRGNLSYGQWSGTTSGGKPVGFGSLTFTASATIHCANGKTITPQAGDQFTNAEFDDNGYLYQATWIKKDGQTKTIMP